MNLKQRLAFYKSKIGCNGVKTWQEVAPKSHYWSKSPAKRVENGAFNGSKRFIENPSDIGLRFVDFADKIAGLRHTGWFCDAFEDRLLRGAVWQLPARNGVPAYVYGWQSSDDKKAAYIDFDITEDKHTAAIRGDHMAERCANDEREHNAKWQAEQDIENAREEIHSTNKEALALISEIKKAGSFSPAVCSALQASLRGMLAYRTEQFNLITKRKADYWSAVE